MTERGVVCPFCDDDGFDLIGLKMHLERWCDKYRETGNPCTEKDCPYFGLHKPLIGCDCLDDRP